MTMRWITISVNWVNLFSQAILDKQLYVQTVTVYTDILVIKNPVQSGTKIDLLLKETKIITSKNSRVIHLLHD